MFRFTIRDVLLVMVIVGLAVGWCVERHHLATEMRKWKDKYNRSEAAKWGLIPPLDN